MCTVTYVPLSNGFCITSNRDEQIARPKAIPPKEYVIANLSITFPKDQKAGGTWFAQSEKATIVLLNGAVEKHLPKTNYRKSRGLIVLDLIATTNIIETWTNIDLQDIEPFTIVLYVADKLYQLQWNETNKSSIELDKNKAHIWSSSTLYSKAIREQRSNWFFDFLNRNESLSAEKLMHFHQFTERENIDYGLQINRNGFLKTVSITQVISSNGTLHINYIDLLANE
jgi:uncharacterized protein with NRDE domain